MLFSFTRFFRMKNDSYYTFHDITKEFRIPKCLLKERKRQRLKEQNIKKEFFRKGKKFRYLFTAEQVEILTCSGFSWLGVKIEK